MNSLLSPHRWPAWLRNGLLLALVATGAVFEGRALLAPHPAPAASVWETSQARRAEGIADIVRAVDAEFAALWEKQGITPAPLADSLTVARRLSLALTGSIPSVQEIRRIESLPEPQRIDAWTGCLLQDRRSNDYLAERLTRVFVGTEDGPFLVFRRRRMVEWMSDQLSRNRPYDEIARALIAAKGVWTTQPEVNFVTATIVQKQGPDEAKLAARVSRAFLGVRIDCVQCHDGKLDNPWKQTDFHQLAAFFGRADMTLTGLRDDSKKPYQVRYLRKPEAETVPPVVPWHPELLPEDGGPRDRLAAWITAEQNRPFARAIVNRVWALLFNQPLVEPVDDLPLDGPFPPGIEALAADFTAHGHDLRRLISVITATRIFRQASHSADPGHPLTPDAEKHWAAFPITRLRPEQMAGSVIQAASLSTLDAEAHVFFRIKRTLDVSNFVKRYGDVGEDDFGSEGGTIPQRLLMMNGNMIANSTNNNPFVNAATRIAMLAPDDATAVETAYLAAFTRRPTAEESAHFVQTLRGKKQAARSRALSDLYWTLLNATEFSWNH